MLLLLLVDVDVVVVTVDVNTWSVRLLAGAGHTTRLPGREG